MIEIFRHTLSNGLRVVHNKNAVTGMVAVNLLYKVGSRNESFEFTGLAHLLEHLMFGGSENAPNFDCCLQEAGGENNAWTNNDITNYYEILPVQNIETALWIEADRMQSLLLTDKSVEVQRSVVREEFKQRCLNAPYGDAGHILRSMVYKRHPYRWPVIGKSLSDISNVPKKTVEDFYRKYYVPNNAILAVVGNIDAERAFALAEKWFGQIPMASAVADVIPEEPQQTASAHKHVLRPVPHNLLIKGYRMCGRQSPDYAVCDLISDILSNGRSSRLFRNVYAKGGLVSSIDASITGDLDPGMFVIKAQLLPGVRYETVEKAISEEIDKLVQYGAGERELQKAGNRFESNALFCNLNNDERAANLTYYEMLGNAGLINQEVDKYRAVTSVMLQDVGQRLFAGNNCSTLYYESDEKK